MKFGTPVQPRCVAMSAPMRRRLRSLNALVAPRRSIIENNILVAIIISLETACQLGEEIVELPHSLTSRQKEYLEFIRNYIKENESSPRLEEIADGVYA